MAPTTAPEVQWGEGGCFTVGATVFHGLGAGADAPEGAMPVFKEPPLVQTYVDLAREALGGQIVEVGLFHGGSTALLAELCRPRSLVGIELSPEVPEPLAAWLAASALADVVHGHFGIDQGDRATLRRLVLEGTEPPIDLVCDDASHVLGPTIDTFEVLFPLLRPGGAYVIEDWSAQLRRAAGIQRRSRRRRKQRERGEDAAASGTARDPWAAAARSGDLADGLAKHLAENPQLLARAYRDFPDALQQSLADGGPHRAIVAQRHPDAVDAIVAGEAPEVVAERLGVDLAALGAAGVPPPGTPLGAGSANLVPFIAHLQRAALVAPEVVASVEARRGIAVVRRGPADLDPEAFDAIAVADSGLTRPT